MKKMLVVFLFLLFVPSAFAALGISPAKRNFDFHPNEIIEIDYNVFADDSSREIEVYAEGDLAQYVTFDKKKLNGGGSFRATISLPGEVEIPGGHRLLIGVREAPREDEFLGSVINIRAVVDIFVPYPGRYVEARLNVPNGNINEIIPMELKIINQGRETLEIDSSLMVYPLASSIDSVLERNFDKFTLASTEEKTFRVAFNTSNIKAGAYIAKALINYGEQKEVNSSFNVGSLFVNITNFTSYVEKDKIQKFYIVIESRWNGILQEVYGEINISNQTFSTSFRTPSLSLGAWEKSELIGYLDTDELEGEYDSEIEVLYSGQSTKTSGKLEVRESGFNIVQLIWVSSVVVALIIVSVILYLFIKRRKSRKRKR